ncbi:tyrosine-type recombinase/integrase [Nonomuraea typhae]|uniref:tyrosine-type recombinase/integrase n=1 Tax=Nonomuraea typhae TaxID=2603600 RepID=UPI001FE71B3B|nr:tyrosine-type recombinase/integrase [Nonomuraea typhae]
MARRPAKAARSPRLAALLDSWVLALESANRSPGTITSYRHTVTLLTTYLSRHELPDTVAGVGAAEIRAFQLATLTGCRAGDEAGGEGAPCPCGVRRSSAGNADKHHRNLKAFFNWLIADGELAGPHPMTTVARPTVPDEAEPVLTDDELRDVLNECSGTSFEERRDTAILRIFMDTGARLDSLGGLRYSSDPEESDVNLGKKLLRIRKKGGDVIYVPLGKKAARDLDRYLRIRALHPDADSEWLWLGKRGRLQNSGIQQMLKRRGTRAGVNNLHAHRFRHRFADDWLSAGGNAQDLMRIAGWSSIQMVGRYGRAAADRRAWQAHARLSPGDRI